MGVEYPTVFVISPDSMLGLSWPELTSTESHEPVETGGEVSCSMDTDTSGSWVGGLMIVGNVTVEEERVEEEREGGGKGGGKREEREGGGKKRRGREEGREEGREGGGKKRVRVNSNSTILLYMFISSAPVFHIRSDSC